MKPAAPLDKAKETFHSETGVFAGIAACVERKCILSALVLAFSAIDQLTWLSLSDEGEVTARDFVLWTTNYLIPGSGLECNGNDLYGARCSLVHSLTAESRSTKKGKAVRIVYSWGSQAPYPKADLDRYTSGVVMVHVETLCQAIERAALAFWKEIEKDKARCVEVNRRARKLLRSDTSLPPRLP